MNARVLSLLIAAVILIAGAAWAFTGARKIDWKQYLRGPRDVPPTRAALSAVLSLVGSFMIFGVVQMAHEGGITPVLFALAYLVAIPLMVSINRRVHRRAQTTAVIEGVDSLITAAFGPLTNLFFWAAQLVAFFGILAGQFVAIRSYVQVFHGIDNLLLALILGALAPVAYTTFAGFFGVMRNDGVQAIFEVLFLGLVAAPVLIDMGVEFRMPAQGWFGSYGALFAIAGPILLIPTLAVRMDIWQRVNTADGSKRGIVVTSTLAIVAVYYVVLSLVGWSVPAVSGESAVLPRIVQSYVTHPLILGLLMGSILSALVSSIDSYLVICSIGLIRVVAKDEWDADVARHERSPGPHLLRLTRLATLLVAAVAGVVAYAWPHLTDLLVASFSAIAVCAPVTLLAVYGARQYSDRFGAISICSGLGAWLLALPFLGKSAFLPGIAISVIVLLSTFRRLDSSLQEKTGE